MVVLRSLGVEHPPAPQVLWPVAFLPHWTTMRNAYYPYIDDMWVANLSDTVSGWDVSIYNSRMSTVSNRLTTAEGRLDSALDDAREAIGMIDDLLDLTWTQKARPFDLLRCILVFVIVE